jgi:hypothetical protein
MIRETGSAMQKLKIRKDRTPRVLRKLAKAEMDARIARRLLALANALGGHEPGGGGRERRHGPPDAEGLGDTL